MLFFFTEKPMTPRLSPLLLASTGRSGSTLLMKVLSLHDQVVVRTYFPYEIRAAQYYYVSAQAGQHYTSFSPLTFKGIEYRPYPAGDVPSVAWGERRSQAALGACGATLIEAYYRFVADLENKPQATYFAEKVIGFEVMSRMVESFKAAKVIFLKRDPRDTFFSIKSFNRKRGYLSFMEDQGDEHMYAGIIAHHKIAKKLVRELGNRAVEIHYEDLITDTRRTLSVFFESLALACNDEHVGRIVDAAFAETDQVRKHMTTHDQNASIGRWNKEAEPETLALFERYRDALIALGYAY